MKTENKVPPKNAPSEERIREYAYGLYVQGGRIPDHDLDNWLEAEARLRVGVPERGTRARSRKPASGFRGKNPSAAPAL